MSAGASPSPLTAYSVTCMRSPSSATEALLGGSRSRSAFSSPSSSLSFRRLHFFFRWIVQGQPEQLFLIEPLKRGPPILDLLGLLLVEHETCKHLPSFQRRLRFPLSVGELTSQRTLATG